MTSTKGFRPNPRTPLIAGRLMADAMEEIAAGMLAGRDHYAERDRVLHELAPAWVKIAGKDAADAAVRGLHFLAPSEYLTASERAGLRMLDEIEAQNRAADRARRDAEYRAYLERLAPHLLPKPRRSAWAVAALAAKIGLALVLLLFLAVAASAREAPARWRALAACGVASLNSPAYERRCRQFSRTERSVVRDYDFPGAGAPKEWERPKPWE